MKLSPLSSSLVLAILVLTGCKPDPALKKGELIDRGTKQPEQPPIHDGDAPPPVDPAHTGSISGTIHLSGKPPARVLIDMSMDPACAMSTTPNQSEQYVVSNGKLANVYVYIKQGAPASVATGSTPAVLDQKGCLYLPHVIAIQQGGSVEFHNSDPTMHNIHTMPTSVGNESVDVSQSPMGQPQVRQFKSPETMMPIRCNNHPWMNAYLNISPNPYFAVSATDGSFTITGLPPGKYILAAIHEKLGEQDVPLTITEKSTTRLDVTYAVK